MTIEVRLDAHQWVNSTRFERALMACPNALTHPDMSVHLFVPVGCSIMVDAGVRLLSYLNQLSHINKQVVLEFESADGAMGYLDRMGFFDALSDPVSVLPRRPSFSRAKLYRGGNRSLVEIARINPSSRDEGIPRRLVDSLLNSVGETPMKGKLETVAFTIFGELVGNVYDHVDIGLDGFAVLQYYGGKRNSVTISVSDSGKGLIETLRPALPEHYPEFQHYSESELLVEMFRRGLSRYGDRQGSGLKTTALHALKFQSSMTVRLPSCQIKLEPTASGEYAATAEMMSGLPLIWGTHISFDFRLDDLQ